MPEISNFTQLRGIDSIQVNYQKNENPKDKHPDIVNLDQDIIDSAINELEVISLQSSALSADYNEYTNKISKALSSSNDTNLVTNPKVLDEELNNVQVLTKDVLSKIEDISGLNLSPQDLAKSDQSNMSFNNSLNQYSGAVNKLLNQIDTLIAKNSKYDSESKDSNNLKNLRDQVSNLSESIIALKNGGISLSEDNISSNSKSDLEQSGLDLNKLNLRDQVSNLSESIIALKNGDISLSGDDTSSNSKSDLEQSGLDLNILNSFNIPLHNEEIISKLADNIAAIDSNIIQEVKSNFYQENMSDLDEILQNIDSQLENIENITNSVTQSNDSYQNKHNILKQEADTSKFALKQSAQQLIANLSEDGTDYTPVTSLLYNEGDRPNIGDSGIKTRQFGGVDYTSSLISELLTQDSNVSILLICMIVFLAMADIDSKIIKADAMQITANQKYISVLTNIQSGLQALQNILPYMDQSTNPPTPITDLYAIYAKAYGTPGDSDLQKSLAPFTSVIQGIIDPETGVSYWSEIDFNSTSDDKEIAGSDENRVYFSEAIDGMVSEANQALAHVGSSLMPRFKMSGSPNDGKSDYGPQVDVAQLNSMTKCISDGATAAGSISQQANVVLQADNETFNQHMQASISVLSAYKNLNRNLWTQ